MGGAGNRTFRLGGNLCCVGASHGRHLHLQPRGKDCRTRHPAAAGRCRAAAGAGRLVGDGHARKGGDQPRGVRLLPLGPVVRAQGFPAKQLADAWALHERFTADPKSIKPEALAARAVPAWLRDELEVTPEFLRQIQREPALWLRARPGTAPTLAEALGNCAPPPPAGQLDELAAGSSAVAKAMADKPTRPTVSDALRYSGPLDLFRTPEFHAGAFEIQDLASQLVGLACAPAPGETWWDACAGDGGKTLHLADQMQNKGLIWATDRSARRLDTLKRRAARAKLFNYRTAPWDGGPKPPTKTKFDGILVDAPCSGVGTWQRNPHARWTTTPEDVRELAAAQRTLLEHVVGSLKVGGRLVYSVCTLTRSETTAVAEAFGAAHPELEACPLLQRPYVRGQTSDARSKTSGAGTSIPAPLTSDIWPLTSSAISLWPQDLNANGMFIAAWRRN